MEGTFRTRVTRRGLLRSTLGVAGVTAAGVLLAACAGQQAEPTATPVPGGSGRRPAQHDPVGGPAAVATGAALTPAAATPASVAKPQANVQGKITVWAWKAFTQAANDQAKQQIQDYAKKQGWETDISDVPTDAMAKLMAGVESGDLPDLFQGSGELPQLYGSNALVDVSSVVKELEADNGKVLPLGQRGGQFAGQVVGSSLDHVRRRLLRSPGRARRRREEARRTRQVRTPAGSWRSS